MTTETQTKPTITIAAQSLKALLDSVLFAADREWGMRYTLSSVLLEYDHKRITAVATDGRRLAKRTLQASCIASGKILMSRKDAKKLASKITKTARGKADIDVVKGNKGNTVKFSWKGYRNKWLHVDCKALEGRFPDWRPIFPTNEPATVLRGLATQFVVEPHAAWDLCSNGKVTLERPAMSVPVTCEGDHQRVPIDLDYLQEWIATCDENDPVTIEIRNDCGAVVCQSTRAADYAFMPMERRS